jgi:capsular exopolysaccharide synthesis family protein
VEDLIIPDGPRDPDGATLDSSPKRRRHALKIFSKRLKVKPVAGTRIIEVSYLNPDPVVAAAVTNSLSEGLIDYNFQIRHAATSRTAQWLSGQLGDLRHQSEELQAKVAQAQRDSGVLSLGGVDSQGREQLYSNVLDKLQQATTAYTQAESSRILKQATYEVAKTGDPEAITGLAGYPMFAGISGMAQSLALVQSLRMHEADTQSQIAALAAKFGPSYPKLAEMQSQLDATQEAIRGEVKRITDRAENDYEVARQVEDNTRKIYLEQKGQADSLNDKTMAYTILRQEADGSRALYEGLFRQMKEAGVLAEFHSNSIAIVDPARVPAKPARPMILIYMAASLGGGLLFGFCGALLRDGMDRKIQSIADLEATLGQPAFGLLPYHKASRVWRKQFVRIRWRAGGGSHAKSATSNHKMLLDAPATETERVVRKLSARTDAEFPALGYTNSSYVESLRALRTSLLLVRGGAPPKVILVTSSIAAEGKSMLSLNLAALLTLQQKNVLLIDADLRRPMLHNRLDVKAGDGLSSFLAGHDDDRNQAILRSDKLPGLHFLPAGQVPPYPAELLGSEQMRRALEAWREQFDFIVIDGPPVLPVTDSVILSTLSDFTLLVARYKITEQHSLDRSYQTLLARTGPNRVGVVLNAIRSDSTYYDFEDSAYSRLQEPTHETV